jgi:signal transduction histidine kinase
MSHKNIATTISVKNRETNVFDENISHDLRARLNIIIGFTELLLDEVPGKINDEQRLSLKDILNSGQRLFNLLNNYLEQP